MKKEIALIDTAELSSRILVVRGVKVMLDRDLAELYGVETRVLNQAVRRNIDRFPKDFMFSITRDEIMDLSQSVISPNIKHAPNVFAFTEHGVAMLSSVLNSKRAVQVNIHIMRAFVKIKEYLPGHNAMFKKIEELEKKVTIHDDNLKTVFVTMRNLILGFPRKKEQSNG